MIHVGLCGWQQENLIKSKKFYKGVKVGDGHGQLEYYASVFPSVEIDSSNYALPTANRVSQWCTPQRVPKNFSFHFKAFGLFTFGTIAQPALPFEVKQLFSDDRPRVSLADLPTEAIDILWRRHFDMFNALTPPQRGCLIFQFQPDFKPTPDRLQYVGQCAARTRAGGVVPSFEFRDRSWYSAPYIAQLAALGAPVALSDDDGLPTASGVTPVVVSDPDVLVVRIHRRSGDHRLLAEDELVAWGDRILRALRAMRALRAARAAAGCAPAPGTAAVNTATNASAIAGAAAAAGRATVGAGACPTLAPLATPPGTPARVQTDGTPAGAAPHGTPTGAAGSDGSAVPPAFPSIATPSRVFTRVRARGALTRAPAPPAAPSDGTLAASGAPPAALPSAQQSAGGGDGEDAMHVAWGPAGAVVRAPPYGGGGDVAVSQQSVSLSQQPLQLSQSGDPVPRAPDGVRVFRRRTASAATDRGDDAYEQASQSLQLSQSAQPSQLSQPPHAAHAPHATQPLQPSQAVQLSQPSPPPAAAHDVPAPPRAAAMGPPTTWAPDAPPSPPPPPRVYIFMGTDAADHSAVNASAMAAAVLAAARAAAAAGPADAAAGPADLVGGLDPHAPAEDWGDTPPTGADGGGGGVCVLTRDAWASAAQWVRRRQTLLTMFAAKPQGGGGPATSSASGGVGGSGGGAGSGDVVAASRTVASPAAPTPTATLQRVPSSSCAVAPVVPSSQVSDVPPAATTTTTTITIITTTTTTTPPANGPAVGPSTTHCFTAVDVPSSDESEVCMRAARVVPPPAKRSLAVAESVSSATPDRGDVVPPATLSTTTATVAVASPARAQGGASAGAGRRPLRSGELPTKRRR